MRYITIQSDSYFPDFLTDHQQGIIQYWKCDVKVFSGLYPVWQKHHLDNRRRIDFKTKLVMRLDVRDVREKSVVNSVESMIKVEC